MATKDTEKKMPKQRIEVPAVAVALKEAEKVNKSKVYAPSTVRQTNEQVVSALSKQISANEQLHASVEQAKAEKKAVIDRAIKDTNTSVGKAKNSSITGYSSLADRQKEQSAAIQKQKAEASTNLAKARAEVAERKRLAEIEKRGKEYETLRQSKEADLPGGYKEEEMRRQITIPHGSALSRAREASAVIPQREYNDTNAYEIKADQRNMNFSPAAQRQQQVSESIAQGAGTPQYIFDKINSESAYKESAFREAVEKGVLDLKDGYLQTTNFLSNLAGIDNPTLQRMAANSTQELAEKQQLINDINERQKGGKAGEIVANLTSQVVAQIPTIIISFLTAGTSTAAQVGAQAAKPAMLKYLSNGVKAVAKNPQFWNSFMRSAGYEYNDALSNGATEQEAFASALVAATSNGIIDASGGLENMPENLAGKTGWRAILELAKSSGEEGLEEIEQNILSSLSQAAVFDHDRQLVSTKSGETAILNVPDSLKEGAYGAASALLGGAPNAMMNVMSGINTPKAQNIVLNENSLEASNLTPTERNTPTSEISSGNLQNRTNVRNEWQTLIAKMKTEGNSEGSIARALQGYFPNQSTSEIKSWLHAYENANKTDFEAYKAEQQQIANEQAYRNSWEYSVDNMQDMSLGDMARSVKENFLPNESVSSIKKKVQSYINSKENNAGAQTPLTKEQEMLKQITVENGAQNGAQTENAVQNGAQAENGAQTQQEAMLNQLIPKNNLYTGMEYRVKNAQAKAEQAENPFNNAKNDVNAPLSAETQQVNNNSNRPEFIYLDDKNDVDSAVENAYDIVIQEKKGVVIPNEVLAKYENAYKNPLEKLKDIVKQYYDSVFKGKSVKVEFNNGVLEIMFENDGKKKSVGWRMNPEKASTFEYLDKMFEQAQYAYSEKNRDVNESTSVPEFHYFITNANIDGQDIPVKLQVRDLVTSKGNEETHYYYHNILNKKNGSVSPSPIGEENFGNRVAGNALTSIGNSISQTPEIVKNEQSTSGNFGKNTIGAAESNPNGYFHATNEYGTIPPGENLARVVDVPQSMDGETKVSRAARTFMEAEVTPDTMIDDFQKEVEDGTFSYEVKTDKDAVEKAAQTISKSESTQDAYNEWLRSIANGKMTKEKSAVGQMLYSMAARSGDTKTAMKIAADLQIAFTEAGQTAQSARLLKKMTPEGKLYYLQKSASEIKTKTGTAEIPKNLADKLLNAKTETEIKSAEEAIIKNIAEQAPVTLKDKVDAWRYLCMLGNPKTHIRNILGNAIFVPARAIKNEIEATLQKTVGKTKWYTEHGGKRTVSNDYGTKEQRALAKEQCEKDLGLLMSDGKYNNETQISQERQIFKNKVLEKVRTSNNAALEGEDKIFLKAAYKESMARYLSANNIDPANITPQQLENARQYSIEEALKATYRDNSKIAEMIMDMKRKNKGADWLISSVLPFTKTPINVLKRGLEYSPVGFLKAISVDAIKVGMGKMTATQMISELSAGLTGSGITALGFLLANAGLLSAGDDDDDKVQSFEELGGGQNYAIKVGDGSYTLDWAAPVCMPLFVGAELDRLLKKDYPNGTLDEVFNAILEALKRVSDPMLSMSMLQNLEDVFKNNDGGGELVVSAIQDYLGQLTPTLGGQIARTADDKARNSYYVDKTNKIPDLFEIGVNKTMAKIPGLEQKLPERVDNWGRTQTNNENIALRALENFVSPGYYKKDSSTEVDKAIKDLYDKTGESSVLPSKIGKSVEVNGVTKNLSADEYVKAQKAKGQTAYKMLEQLISDPNYKKASPETRADMVSDAYKYATAKGKKAVSNYKTEKWMSEMEQAKKDGDIKNNAEYISNRTIYNSLIADKDGDKIIKSKNEKYLDYLVSDKNTSDTKDLALFSLISDKDISGVYKVPVNDKERVMLAQLMVNQDDKKADVASYVAKSGISTQEALAQLNVANREKAKMASLTEKQAKSVASLIKKGWTEEEVLKAASAVTSVDSGKEYGFTGSNYSNAVKMLTSVGFDKEKAQEFAKAYSSTSSGSSGGGVSYGNKKDWVNNYVAENDVPVTTALAKFNVDTGAKTWKKLSDAQEKACTNVMGVFGWSKSEVLRAASAVTNCNSSTYGLGRGGYSNAIAMLKSVGYSDDKITEFLKYYPT